MELMPTPKDTLHRDGTAQLYRFRRPDQVTGEAGMPLLLVPSMINRWYVLDLRRGASMAESLTRSGIDTFCLDWGIPEDEAGNEVIIHAVVPSDGWVGDETLDPARTLLSELYDGTLAEYVAVPTRNLVPKPAALSFEAAACLSTAWLTAYRMLFVNAGLTPGATVLVQGAGGGVSSAVIQLGSAAGYRVWTTSRDEGKRARALEIGADKAFSSGERLPERVDAVLETVGAATWSHSINSLKPGGTVVISGATSGDAPAKAELTKIFFRQLRVVGSTMGTRGELERLANFVVNQGITPVIDSTMPLVDARQGFQKMAAGDVFGKVVFTL